MCVQHLESAFVTEFIKGCTQFLHSFVRSQAGNILEHDRSWPNFADKAQIFKNEVIPFVANLRGPVESLQSREPLARWAPCKQIDFALLPLNFPKQCAAAQILNILLEDQDFRMIPRIGLDCQRIDFDCSDYVEASFLQALRQTSAAGEQIYGGLATVHTVRPSPAHAVRFIPQWRCQNQTSARFDRHPAK